MIRIAYFGTNEFSATVLQALAHTQGFTIIGVVTQPDRPVGRSQQVTPPPVKTAAERLGVPIFQPDDLKNLAVNSLPSADIFLVYAYGLLIPKNVLSAPPHGTINIHPSLLPKYRGPTPVQSAIINNDTETGVSIMLLDEQMDHGPILNQIKLPIDPDDTTDTLTEKLVTAATPLLIQTIADWINKKITPQPQDNSAATYCKMLARDDGRVDWSKPAVEIYNLYRALAPWPGIWTTWEGRRLKLLRIEKSPLVFVPSSSRWEGGGVSQAVVKDNHIFITCGQGVVEILELQLEGRKAVSASVFLNGFKNFAKTRLI